MLPRDKFAIGIMALLEMLGVERSEAALELLYATLRHLSEQAFERAIARAARECKFMPAASELLEFSGFAKTSDRALVAWSEVREAIHAHGVYVSVDFEDASINAAIRGMGGWERVCMMPTAEAEVWGRKEFERQYLAFSAHLPGEYARPLMGIADVHNIGKGLSAPKPVKVMSSLTPSPRLAIAGGST